MSRQRAIARKMYTRHEIRVLLGYEIIGSCVALCWLFQRLSRLINITKRAAISCPGKTCAMCNSMLCTPFFPYESRRIACALSRPFFTHVWRARADNEHEKTSFSSSWRARHCQFYAVTITEEVIEISVHISLHVFKCSKIFRSYKFVVLRATEGEGIRNLDNLAF